VAEVRSPAEASGADVLSEAHLRSIGPVVDTVSSPRRRLIFHSQRRFVLLLLCFLSVFVCFVFFVVVCFVVVLLFLCCRPSVVVADVRAPAEASGAGLFGDAHLRSIGRSEWDMDAGVAVVTFASFSEGSHGAVGGVGDIPTTGKRTHNKIKPRCVGASGVGGPAVGVGRVEAPVGSGGAGVGVSVVGVGDVGSGGADGGLPLASAAWLDVPVVGWPVVGGGQVGAAAGSDSARVVADTADVVGCGVSSASSRAFVSAVGSPCCLI
jgi:hypothetical protein